MDNVSEIDFNHAVLIANVQLICEHEHYDDIVERPRGIAVPYGLFNQPTFLPHLCSSAAWRVA